MGIYQLQTEYTCRKAESWDCLLYTSDAADERSSVDLGGRRIIKKKNKEDSIGRRYDIKKITSNIQSRQVKI